MRLLIIEDDICLSALMKEGMQKHGFSVDVTNSGADGEEKAFCNTYDTIFLDLNLPDKDGLDVLKFLRENDVQTPVMIVTARSEVAQRALGLDLGADDYVTKPFDFVELNARVRALIRRSYGRSENNLCVGCLKIEPRMRRAYVSERELVLSAKEFDILEYIASRSPAVVSSEDIVEHVYDENFDPFSSVLRVHIANLRKKLCAAGGDNMLVTTKGRGYSLCPND